MGAEELMQGKWQLRESDANFDAFMEKLGVGYLTRKLGNASKPLVTISKDQTDPSIWHMKQESLVKTSQIDFKLGQQFDETTADGRKVKSTMTLEQPNRLVHEMLGTEGGKDSRCVRNFEAKSMSCVCSVDDVVTTRIYDRV